MIRKGLIGSIIALAIMAGIILWTAANLPDNDQIPIHFNAQGEPDAFGNKSEAMLGLWLVFGTTVFTAGLLAGLPKIMPRQANLEKSAKAYLVTWMGVMALMVFVTGFIAWAMLSAIEGRTLTTNPVRFILIPMSLVFILLGNYLPKTKSNWIFGVRTPWSLSSDLSWQKSNRLAGILFMLSGVITLAAAFLLKPELALALSVGSVLLTAIISIYWSWHVWRHADDRKDEGDYV